MKQIFTDDLDFDAIKNNIKIFLSGQPEFTEYNFEGSVMSTLLDILAYNTHYNLLYTNLAVNESFIDSASKRSSVISIARSLGYMARSIRSSKALLNVTVTLPVGETPDTLTLPSGTKFSTIIGDKTFTFQTMTDATAPRFGGSGQYNFQALQVLEGLKVASTYTFTAGTKFVVPNPNIDLSTLSVVVYDSPSSSNFTKYYTGDDLLHVKATDAAFFVKQREDMNYEIYFGNNAIGKAIEVGNQIKMVYMVSSGAAANGANAFTYQSGFRGNISYAISTVQVAFNGTNAEEIESIRYNAPKAFISQNRAVTSFDYENLLYAKFPEIESIRVWGGQDNIPKIYGKVFICAKPYNGSRFSTAAKLNFKETLLMTKGVISVTPEFIDAESLNLDILCNVKYNKTISKFTPGQMKTNITNEINSYNTELAKFNTSFRYSRLSSMVDLVDDSILSNEILVTIRTEISPFLQLKSSYSRNFGIPIKRVIGSSFYTTRFYLDDTDVKFYIKDTDGILSLYWEDVLGDPIFYKDVGAINYQTGNWVIDEIKINRLHDPLLEFVYAPANQDIGVSKNILLIIKNATVNVIAE